MLTGKKQHSNFVITAFRQRTL